MSLTAAERAVMTWNSRPPGPPTFWYAVGTAVRKVGRAIDTLGASVQGDCAHNDKCELRNAPEEAGPCSFVVALPVWTSSRTD